MAARQSSRFLRPFLYLTGAGIIGAGTLYVVYRPRHVPGQEAAAVPPFYQDGVFHPPNFPQVATRAEQIAALKASSGIVTETVKNTLSGLIGKGKETGEQQKNAAAAEPYDLLVIGGGATGTGIALDAATRGLKVALVERDDFASGTSSKSTKLVHGGVRYLEKAVKELDYNQ